MLCAAGVHGGYKPAADLDFGRRRGKMVGQRWTVSNLLAAAVAQGMDKAAAPVAAAVVLVLVAA